MEQQRKKIVLSGIQPSGSPTLGNYVGCLLYTSDAADE